MKNKQFKELFELFSKIDNAKEAHMLLEDILTSKELESLAERWQIIKLLNQNIPQRKISKKLGVSISKISRGSRFLQYGTGGFKHFLKK